MRRLGGYGAVDHRRDGLLQGRSLTARDRLLGVHSRRQARLERADLGDEPLGRRRNLLLRHPQQQLGQRGEREQHHSSKTPSARSLGAAGAAAAADRARAACARPPRAAYPPARTPPAPGKRRSRAAAGPRAAGTLASGPCHPRGSPTGRRPPLASAPSEQRPRQDDLAVGDGDQVRRDIGPQPAVLRRRDGQRGELPPPCSGESCVARSSRRECR